MFRRLKPAATRRRTFGTNPTQNLFRHWNFPKTKERTQNGVEARSRNCQTAVCLFDEPLAEPNCRENVRGRAGVNVCSGSTSRNAVKTVSAADLNWATHVLVMEQPHKKRLKPQFCEKLRGKQVYVLDIPDEYRFMDPELITELQHAVRDLNVF